MQRHLVRAVVGAILLFGATAAVPPPASGQSFPSLCSEMTDSITRLYLAYFGRQPDTAGFDHWVSLYQTGTSSLTDISAALAETPEFLDRGLESNEAFIDWVYAEVVEIEPDAGSRTYWIDALNGGYPRSTMMLTFTESQEFVTKTDTAVPLAGYLRWYPAGTHWYCDIGASTIEVPPLIGPIWADYLLRNNGDLPDRASLFTQKAPGERTVTMTTGTLPAGFTNCDWDGEFTGDGDYGQYLEVDVGAATAWTVVFYPLTIGPDRLGWQLV